MKKILVLCLFVLLLGLVALPASAATGDVLVMEGETVVGEYGSLSAALAELWPGQHIQLHGDIDEDAMIPGDVLIDLNGNTLSGVIISDGACFIDSATDGYNGQKAGRLIPLTGKPAAHVKTETKRYLTVCQGNSYSFHRFYMAITKASVNPANVGVGYKARFIGSEEAEQALGNSLAFGYTMWLEGSGKVTRGLSAEEFGGVRELTLRINNFLSAEKTAEENSKRAETPVYACVYVRLGDGTLIETAPVCYTFRDILEAANANYAHYTQAQQKSLATISDRFSASMRSYDISSFHHTSGSEWKAQTNSSFNTMIKKSQNIESGSYYLTEDVDIGSNGIRILAGRTVNICLNGHALHSNVRLLRVYGNLNICDCHTEGHEGTLQSASTYDNDATDGGESAPIMYSYAGSQINFYGGNMKALKPISFAGLIAISHDDDDKTKPASIFNMYGGTMYGNTVDGGSAKDKAGSGGAVSVWNGATFNMYGGTVYGGTAHQGAAFTVVSKTSTLNIYGGTITGGTSVKRTDAAGKTSMAKGGNIYATGCVNIYGGLIDNGSALEGQGGNVYSTGPVNVYGGTITNGKATAYSSSAGVAVYNSARGGGIYIYENQIHISGEAVIYGNENSNLYLTPMATVDFKELTGSAKIGMLAETTGVVSQDIATADHLVADQSGYNFYTVNNRVMFSKTQPKTFKETVKTFCVGYSAVDITPTESGLIMSPWGNPNGRATDGTVGYNLMATTVAISDQQNKTVLMITLDLQSVPDEFGSFIRQRISAATDVPADQIFITATHTHNCPSLTSSNAGNVRYLAMLSGQLVTGAINALADRGTATMKTGQFETARMNFTRNYYYYLNNDKTTEPVYFGDQYGVRPQNGETIYRIREGDHTMHLIEFTRTGSKKPILMVNWRAHPHRSGGMWKYSVDADVIGATREYLQNNSNYLFAYYQGASGNMNTFSKIETETYKSGKIKEYGAEMGRQIINNGLPKLKTAAVGLLQTMTYTYAAPINHDDEMYYEDAQRLIDYYYANPDKMDTFEEQVEEANRLNPDGTRKYDGVYTVYHAKQIVARHEAAETKDIRLSAFSIGKSVGFSTAPGEFWDRVSEELELERSPFPSTWFIGYCNGAVGYVPYGVAGNYPSYEYYSCVFKQDEVVLQIMDYLEDFLKQQYANAK